MYTRYKYHIFDFKLTRPIAEFDIIEREDGVTMEEAAGAISAMEVFNPKRQKLWLVFSFDYLCVLRNQNFFYIK